MFQYFPQATLEHHPSRRVLAFQYLRDDGQVCVFVEWQVPADSLVYDHSKSIAIRKFRRAAVLEPEPLWGDKFWAHPSRRATRRV